MRVSMALAALALLAGTGVCLAQPAGITREMIATALPEEGAPQAEPGPYAVSAVPAFGADGLLALWPSDLEPFPARDTLPVVVWGNGGCAIDSSRYIGFITTIASHGFLVVTTTPREGDSRKQATADDLRVAIDWAERENARTGSPLNGKIEVRRVAAMGQSCGGALAITLGTDPRVGTIGVFNSGVPSPDLGPRPNFPTMDALKELHGPVLLVNGHERDFMMASSRATYDAIDSVPAFYGARLGAGHSATAYHPGGGEFANVASKWLLWQLKGDKRAGAMFVGSDCALCTDPNWEVESKRLAN